MKRAFLVGILVGAVAAAGTAFAGTSKPTTSMKHAARAAQASGLERLATVRIAHAVTANGEPLAAGTYVLTLDGEGPAVEGETSVERWVEFHQRGQVKGKELASVIPDDKIGQIAKDPNKPKPGHARVEVLKGGEYLRIWVNKGGNNYLVHLPIVKK
ncbi:MAG: hypothetical protein KGN76_03105 [Acidobacteriota bacterium]|nr:hypothetical protein [Acidobacteriota bacterium]